MGASTERDLDSYWRRRALALAGVLGGVALLAWACTGDTGEPVQNARAVESTSPPLPPTAMPTVTVTVTVTPRPRPVNGGGPCREKDLVYTMSSTATSFSGSERPGFTVTVVNVGKVPCAFDTGSLDVRITSGSDRVWSSAKCRRGGAGEKILNRGVPHLDTIVWDRKRCDGESPARPGTYVAELKDKKAEKQIFHLR
ncbi:MAG: hypothetical protein FWJ90_23385 [Actinomadura sp.]